MRSRVSAYIYGNIFVLAALFATSPEGVAHWSAVVIVGATSATTFFAHVVAHNIGQAIGRTENEEDLRAQLSKEARDAVPIMTSGIVVRRLSDAASGRGGFWSGLALAGIGIVIAALKQILTH